jgi:hypothetical protein
MATKKGIALPPEVHAEFKTRAEQAGLSLAAWVTAAGRQAARRQAAQAYAAALQEPDMAAEVAQWLSHAAPAGQAAWNASTDEAAA